VDDAASHFVTFNLDSTSVEKIFRYTRVHLFLTHLCDAMSAFASPEQLFTSINAVRNSLVSLPQRFIPWLKAAYIFCEAVGASASSDWVRLVQSTRRLEECVSVLADVRITVAGEGYKEATFLRLMQERAASGYASALSIKATEADKKVNCEMQSMTTDELAKVRIRQEDETNPYGVSSLRAGGYDDDAILNIRFPPKLLWACDFDAVLLRKRGFKASKLLAAGYGISSLYQAGFK
jgi:hypothetical protein